LTATSRPFLTSRGKERMLRAYLVRADATGLRVLDPDSPDNIERGTLWCYVGDDRDVLFRYAPTGTGESGPWQCLEGRTGFIQADAASVFDRLFNGQAASAVEVGCWAHARREFEALRDTDCRVAYPLQLIGRLYGSNTWRTCSNWRRSNAPHCGLSAVPGSWTS
jgi:hypothetical protein